MPYTFGAGGADDINVNISVNLLAGSSVALVTGWWYFTAIGTDVLWSAGDVACAQLGSTTTINLTTDGVTTDGVWRGTFATMSNNIWYFLAFLGTFNNTGPAGSVKMWQGTQDTAPVEVSVSQITAPAGNFTGSTAFTIGNKGTSATLAFKGDIGNVTVQHDSSGGPLVPASFSTWTQAEVDMIARMYVMPAWLGNYGALGEGGKGNAGQKPALLVDLDNANTLAWGRNAQGVYPLVAVVNGATKTVTTGNPRPAISRPGWPLRRR